jgi:hypothetical protein
VLMEPHRYACDGLSWSSCRPIETRMCSPEAGCGMPSAATDNSRLATHFITWVIASHGASPLFGPPSGRGSAGRLSQYQPEQVVVFAVPSQPISSCFTW